MQETQRIRTYLSADLRLKLFEIQQINDVTAAVGMTDAVYSRLASYAALLPV